LTNSLKLLLTQTISGDGEATLRYLNVVDPNKKDVKSGDWIDGKPIRKENTSGGDGTILVASSQIAGVNSSIINGDHQDVFSSAEAVEIIKSFLNLTQPLVFIKPELQNIDKQVLLTITADDNLGMKLTGKGAEESVGDNNELIVINPTGGLYNLKISSDKNKNTVVYIMLIKKDDEAVTKIYRIKLKKDKETSFNLEYTPASVNPINFYPL